MNGKVIPFPKKYLTTKDRSDIIVNDISLILLDLLERNGINTADKDFVLDMAWVVKFHNNLNWDAEADSILISRHL